MTANRGPDPTERNRLTPGEVHDLDRLRLDPFDSAPMYDADEQPIGWRHILEVTLAPFYREVNR